MANDNKKKLKRKKEKAIRLLICYLSCNSAATFFIFGGILFSHYYRNFALSWRYSSFCLLDQPCEISFTVLKEVEPPIYLYFYLEDLYTMNWGYLNSIDKAQLASTEKIDTQSTSHNCRAYYTNWEMEKDVSVKNTILDPNSTAYPCGLRSYLIFNGFPLN